MDLVALSFFLIGVISILSALFLLASVYFSFRQQRVIEYMLFKKVYDPILLEKAMCKFWVWPIDKLYNDAGTS